MTVPRWDAQKWHEEHTRPARPARRPRLKLAATLAAVTLCLGAAAVSATAFGEDEKIGICHATGSAERPYVFLEADKDGYEHGHHRHHENDFFVSPGAGGCEGDAAYLGNQTSAPDNATKDAGQTNETVSDGEPAAPDNGTAPDNATTEPDAGAPDNNTAEPDTGANATAEPDNATAPPAGDAWVRQTSWQDQDDVVLAIQAGSGADGAQDVVLTDNLPDVRRTWHLGGADARDCVLDGLELTCWFGDLAPGQTRNVELRSYTDRMPCGFSLTNTANVDSLDDAEERNNASSASILARSC